MEDSGHTGDQDALTAEVLADIETVTMADRIRELESRVIHDESPPGPDELPDGYRVVVHGMLTTSRRSGLTFQRGRRWSIIDDLGQVLVRYRSDWEYAESQGLAWRKYSSGISGFNPPTAEKRCRAIAVMTGEQCMQRRVPGSDSGYCGFHLKRHGSISARQKTRRDLRAEIPIVYRERLNGALLERFNEAFDTGPKALDLWEELAMFRVVAAKAVEVYDKAEATGELKNIYPAMALLKDSLNEVAKISSQITSNRVKIQGALAQAAIGTMVHQIVSVAYEVFGSDEENLTLVEQFAAKIREDVDAPSIVNGTVLNPETEVRGMIDSVPMFEGNAGGPDDGLDGLDDGLDSDDDDDDGDDDDD